MIQKVRIVPCRPTSRTKRHFLKDILRRPKTVAEFKLGGRKIFAKDIIEKSMIGDDVTTHDFEKHRSHANNS
jgi:hypothetical protein